MSGTRLYIFDADGTLRWTTVPGQKYPLGRDEWRLMPGVTARLRAIPWAAGGPWLAIASNQNGVAAGELTAETAGTLMREMIEAAVGFLPPRCRIGMCMCSATARCPCRKPEPGLLLAHLAHFGVRAEEALYVGDLGIDEQAARAAGIPFRYAAAFFSEMESCRSSANERNLAD